jgi:uncharacterized protein
VEVEAPLKVKVLRDVRIPMRDGVNLAANLYLPEREGRYPGVFSFYPYLKDAWIGIDFEPHYQHIASQGYAVMQVDFRGTGASQGANPHPFDLQERRDGFDVVEWMAVQTWCTGAIGVWGISYGGITALSIASTRPPHLRAIIPIDATFDNYDWLLRTHGCRGLLLADVDWGTRMAACNLLPPVRQDPSGDWVSNWRERLGGSSPWFMDWHGAPPDPTFWSTRKIPLEDVVVPTFAICGWHDAYTAPAFRVFERVKAPARVLIGPWKHVLPDLSPQWPIGGLHEMVRWWDRWLKDIRNGVDEEPPVAIFVQGSNEWRYETEWPIARTVPRRLYPSSDGRLATEPPPRSEVFPYEYDSRVGLDAAGYNGHRLHLAIPSDQSADDHASLVFTSASLQEDLEITGEPRMTAVLSADTSELTLVAKLCLVDADGRSRMISRGNANPARTDAHAEMSPLEPGQPRKVSFAMHPTSVVARAGERLRLSIAGADFPELWPTPIPYTMQIYSGPAGDCFIDVPVVPPRVEAIGAPTFKPARSDIDPPQEQIANSNEQYDVVHRSLDARVAAFETRLVSKHRIEKESVLTGSHWAMVKTDADRPGTTNLNTETKYELNRPGSSVSVFVASTVTHYGVNCRAVIELNGRPFWQMTWRKDLDDWLPRS